MTTPGQPPYDIMSFEDLRWERGCIEKIIEEEWEGEDLQHRRTQVAWYNAAIAWQIFNGEVVE